MKVYTNIFNDIISLENLFLAWDKFKIGKRNRKDVQEFEPTFIHDSFSCRVDKGTHKGFNCLDFLSDKQLNDLYRDKNSNTDLINAVTKIINSRKNKM